MPRCRPRTLPASYAVFLLALLLGLAGCSSNAPGSTPERPQSPRSSPADTPTRPAKLTASSGGTKATATASPVQPAAAPARPAGVLLGIDVLAAQNFAPLVGKRVGLFTHPAGVNRFGVSTVEVLRRAPGVKLAALFGPEHGIYGDKAAEKEVPDSVDPRTGLPAYSLYGKRKKPTRDQLSSLQVVVIDLQDIGVRSYTFSTWMRYMMEACFEAGIEVMVLDRPNPLGGLKVDGPPLDPENKSDVGGFPMPYVHGLTMGELARWSAATPGILNVSEPVRARGKLTVIPMRGWRRSMRWPETGLRFVPTSPNVPDFAACVGYAMTGLGCIVGEFTHGVGTQYPFRGIFYTGKPIDGIVRELEALRLPGLAFRKVSVTKPNGQSALGVYTEVIDWDDWRPTELSFHLMRLTSKFAGRNVFAASRDKERQFKVHVGSTAVWDALRRDGARTDIEAFLAEWQRKNLVFREQVRPFWLYD